MNLNSKIFVAGHRGLVGSAIVRRLKEKGYTNISTRTRYELDLTNTNAVATFFEEEQPEYVFLAAAKVGGIVANNTYRATFIYENLMIQNNVVHQSYTNNVKKLLFLGSTCIYPKEAPQPLKESYLLTAPLEYTNEPYAIAKIAGIKLCESYNLQYGTNFISAMPTNLYGPNDNFDLEKSHVLPALLRKIYLGKLWEENNWKAIKEDLTKLPIMSVNGSATTEEIIAVFLKFGITKLREEINVEIWGSGKPMRELLWVEDMADACLFLMNNYNFESETKGMDEVRNTHINIGTGMDISISELAKLIKTIVGFKGSFVYNTDKPDGTLKKLTDVSKINQMGWKASVNLQDGIQRLYQWYRNA